MIPLTDLKAQYDTIEDEVNAAIRRVLEGGQFILGPEVQAFEQEMAAYCGTEYAVGVASGTDALHLALLACGVGPGDEVITTPFTFIATAETIAKCGARPVFVDIEPRTCNINPHLIEAKINPGTKAIVPVHLYGQPAEMEVVLEIARRHSLSVIEDCAQAVGAEYRGRKAGSLGSAGCLSFFPAKNLGAYGDGGMVVTDAPDVAERVNLLRKHGTRGGYRYEMAGFNSRLDALQAAILRVKLRHLEEWNERRRANAALYTRLLQKVDGVQPPSHREDDRPSCNYYTVQLASALEREKLRRHLDAKGIQTAVYYPLSLHLQEVYRHLGYRPGDFPEAERAQEHVLSLPMYPELTEEQVERVVGAIKEFVAGDQ